MLFSNLKQDERFQNTFRTAQTMEVFSEDFSNHLQTNESYSNATNAPPTRRSSPWPWPWPIDHYNELYTHQRTILCASAIQPITRNHPMKVHRPQRTQTFSFEQPSTATLPITHTHTTTAPRPSSARSHTLSLCDSADTILDLFAALRVHVDIDDCQVCANLYAVSKCKHKPNQTCT